MNDRECYTCGVTQTTCWRRHSKLGFHLCNACGLNNVDIKIPKKTNKIVKENFSKDI